MTDPTRTSVKRLDSLTGLRFLAAFLVFGFHGTSILVGTTADVSDAVFGGGQSGVAFFFILSGFVLSWSARSSDNPGGFYWRRFARIYPAYLVSLALGFVALLLTAPEEITAVWAPVLMIQSWFPSTDIVFSLSDPAWSLSCEAFFYLLFPLIVARARRLQPRGLVVLGIVCLFLILAVATAATAIRSADPSTFAADWLVGFLPPARLPEFVLGIVLALLLRGGHIAWRVPFWPAAALALGAVALASADGSLFRITAIPVVPFLLLICATAQLDLSGSRGVLNSRVGTTLGDWSYAFYLVHTFCMGLVHTLAERAGIADAGQGIPVWLAAFVVSLVGAAALHKLVEVPANRFLIRIRSRRARIPLVE